MRIISRTPLGECTVLGSRFGAPVGHVMCEVFNVHIRWIEHQRDMYLASNKEARERVDAYLVLVRAFAAGSRHISMNDLRIAARELARIPYGN